MAPKKLVLEEAIHDSPKTQKLLSIYEEDARMLRQFAYEFHGHCEKIQAAQQALATASQGLAALIKKYGSMKFPLEKKNSCLLTTFPLLADCIEEIGSMHQQVARQISDSMISPISRFISADLEELMQLQNLYSLISDEHEQSMQRYSKLSTRCSEQARCEAIDEVYHIRKKLHRTALHYFSAMNLVQQRRQLAFLEPLAGHLRAHLSLFRLANEFVDRRDLDALSGNARGLLLCLQREFDLERAEAAASVTRLESAYPDGVFLPDEIEESGKAEQQQLIAGYLMHRSGGQAAPARWERLHFALRNSSGRLHIEARRDQQTLTGSASQQLRRCALRLRGCAVTAAPAELDDRRNVFIVTVPGVRPLILQAESARQRDGWIAAIREAAAAAAAAASSDSTSTTPTPEDVDLDSSDESDKGEKNDDEDEEGDLVGNGPSLWLDDASTDRSSMALALGADGCVAGAAFSRQFDVQLVGRCWTEPDGVVDAVLAAAAAATSATSLEVKLLLTVSELGVWLVEPETRLIRCRLPLGRARVWPASKRLLGLTGTDGLGRFRRVDCLALRLLATGGIDEAGLPSATTESVVAAVSAAARSAELAHERETALLLSNIGRLPDVSPPTPPPRQQQQLQAGAADIKSVPVELERESSELGEDKSDEEDTVESWA